MISTEANPQIRLNTLLNDERFISVSRHVMASGRSIEVHRDITSERLAEERANDTMHALIEPISRRIIESHGGHLWASANVEQGATSCFTLPST